MNLNLQVCAFSIQIQMMQYFGATLPRKVRTQLCLRYKVLGHYLDVARFEIKGKKEILARRYPCMYRDTSGQEGERVVSSQDVSWTPGQHQAQPGLVSPPLGSLMSPPLGSRAGGLCLVSFEGRVAASGHH